MVYSCTKTRERSDAYWDTDVCLQTKWRVLKNLRQISFILTNVKKVKKMMILLKNS